MDRTWVLGDFAESPINPRTSCYITNKYLKNLSHPELSILLHAAESVPALWGRGWGRGEKGIISSFKIEWFNAR